MLDSLTLYLNKMLYELNIREFLWRLIYNILQIGDVRLSFCFKIFTP